MGPFTEAQQLEMVSSLRQTARGTRSFSRRRSSSRAPSDSMMSPDAPSTNSPVARVAKRIENGSEDNISFYFSESLRPS